MSTPAAIAIFNSNDDTVEMLRLILEARGFVVVSGHITDIKRGNFDLPAFLEQHRPRVIIYDLSPPYEQTWNLLTRLREDGPLKGYELLLTTTNKQKVEEIIGVKEVFEIVGKPYDLDVIAQSVIHRAGGQK